MDTLKFESFDGSPCRIMWSQRDSSLRQSGAGNVFVRFLPKDADTKVLHEAFSQFGKIMSLKV